MPRIRENGCHTLLCTAVVAFYRITELCKMKYGNRGNFECMAFSVVNQFFNNRKRLIFPDETI